MEIPIQVADIAVVYDNDDYDNDGNRYDSNPITKTANGGNAFKPWSCKGKRF